MSNDCYALSQTAGRDVALDERHDLAVAVGVGFDDLFPRPHLVERARNRVKRRLRHALMDMSSQLENQDFVVIARKGVEDLSYQDIYSNLVHVLKIAKLYKD